MFNVYNLSAARLARRDADFERGQDDAAQWLSVERDGRIPSDAAIEEQSNWYLADRDAGSYSYRVGYALLLAEVVAQSNALWEAFEADQAARYGD